MAPSNTLPLDGIELKSPKLETMRTPDWKSQVKETWAFIEKNYIVTKTTKCSTHVHISLKRAGSGDSGMGLQSIKRIAQCIIHFEPAFEALTSRERRGNIYSSSNWIDNKWFAHPDMTRAKVIEAIGNCGSTAEVIELMSPKPQDRFWAWNFQAMKKFGTIEFRKGSASLNGDQAVAWAELVLLFVQSALVADIRSLKTVPANIRGLKFFLGEHNLGDVATLFRGKGDRETLQPKLLFPNPAEKEMLEKKLAEDAKEQVRLGRRRWF